MSSSTPGTHRLVDVSAAEEAHAMTDVIAGSQAALARLYDLTAARIFAMILDVLPDRGAAEVVLQETYVGVWARAAEFTSATGTPTAWMATIALRRAIDHPSASISVEDRRVDAGNGVLHRLPRDERECLALSRHAGLSEVRIAAHTGRTVAAVRALIRAGLSRLRAEGEAEPAAPEAVVATTAPVVVAVAASTLHAAMPSGASPTQAPA